MKKNDQQKLRRQQIFWWLGALLWVICGIACGVLVQFYPKNQPLFLPVFVIPPVILTYLVPEGIFRSVRKASPAAKIGLGLFLLMIGGAMIAVGYVFIMSWLQNIT